MIVPYLQAAATAPLSARPNHHEAEIRYVAERDSVTPFLAALELWREHHAVEPELQLGADRCQLSIGATA